MSDAMGKKKLHELVEATHKMRQEQRAYFQTRDGTHLSAAKKLERKVDQLLDEVRGQKRLF